MDRLLLLLLIILNYNLSFAQKEGYVWTFGDSAAIDFNNINPVPILGTGLSSYECSSTICDSLGNLLFYAGNYSYIQPGWYTINIWNKYNHLIENGTDIYGFSTSAQGCLFVPHPGNQNLIYLFTHGRYNPTPPDSKIYYSILDKSANSDSGEVTVKNISLSPIPKAEQMFAVRHGNGRDWWLITHDANNQFYKYILSVNGIVGPSIQATGNNFSFYASVGNMKLSPDGNKLVIVGGNGIIDLFNFDRCTGLLTNWIQLGFGPVPLDAKYGCSFSPNSKLLYVSDYDTALYQFNLDAIDIKASRQIIWIRPDTSDSRIGQHLLGPDGKIYISNLKPTWSPNNLFNLENMNLSVINNPDSLGAACDFQPYSFNLGGRRSFGGLPNIPDYNLGVIEGSICDSLTVGRNEMYQVNPITVYPNPSSDFITIYIQGDMKSVTVSLINVLGKEIFRDEIMNETEIDVSQFTKGIYFLELTDKIKNFKSVKKIVLQ